MNYDVIVVGELNADLLLNEIQQFPAVGKEIIADQMELALGSSSAIFASNLRTLGAKVKFLGKVGDDDFGDFCINRLKSKNIDTSGIRVDKEDGTGLTVVLNYGEDRAMVTYQGAMKTFSLDDIDFNKLAGAKHLHFANYFLQPGIAPGVGKLFKTAKEMGLTVSFDTQIDPLDEWDIDLKPILPYVDIFLPNKSEFMAMTRSDNWETAMHDLNEYVNIIAMKDGNNGSYVYHDGKISHCKPFLNEQVVDAIGAGDSFNAGFIYQFINGMAIGKCQEFGNLTGAISTTAAGGTGAFSSREAVEKVAKEKFNYKDV